MISSANCILNNNIISAYTVALMDESIEKVRRALQCGLRKRDLAQKAGVHFNSLRYVDDPNWNPTASTLKKLCSGIDAIAAELIGDSQDAA